MSIQPLLVILRTTNSVANHNYQRNNDLIMSILKGQKTNIMLATMPIPTNSINFFFALESPTETFLFNILLVYDATLK